MLIGVHEQYVGENKTTPTETLKRYPHTQITREFVNNPLKPQNILTKIVNLCQPVWAAGLVSVISLKFGVEEVKNGQWKPHIDQAVSWLKNNKHTHDTILVIWHEPENDIPKYFRNAEDFVAYFNRVHGWVKAIAPELKTCHAALGYRYADRIDINDERARVWLSHQADICALDIYSGRNFPLGQILPEMSAFKRWGSAVGGRDWALSERGFQAGARDSWQRASTIEREWQWLAGLAPEEQPRFYITWLTEGTENEPKLKPDSAMHSALQNSMGALREQVKPEPPTPAPPAVMKCPLCKGSGEVPKGSYTTTVVS